MKLKWITLSAALALCVLAILLASPSTQHGAEAVPTTPFLALRRVPLPEFPAKAAELIHAAAPADREKTVPEVLRAVATLSRPGVMPYVVSAVCRADPEVTGAVVATATELQPLDVFIFSRAAACAAPDQAEQIVFSACKAAPKECVNVTLVVSKQLPAAKASILKGLTDALPQLKNLLYRAEILAGTDDPPTVARQAIQLFNESLKPPSK